MTMLKNACCAILGQSPMRFAWGFDEEDTDCKAMKLELLQQIMVLRQQGVTRFMVACDPGVGLYAAEAINALRETDGNLMLFCVTPHEGQATKWAPYLRERYFTMLEKCTYLSMVNRHWEPDCQLTAYKRIIDQSDVVLAVYDPASACGDESDHAMRYATEKRKPTVLIRPGNAGVTTYLNR
jgi:uncharacterized phage-like protein YoqJ